MLMQMLIKCKAKSHLVSMPLGSN